MPATALRRVSTSYLKSLQRFVFIQRRASSTTSQLTESCAATQEAHHQSQVTVKWLWQARPCVPLLAEQSCTAAGAGTGTHCHD